MAKNDDKRLHYLPDWLQASVGCAYGQGVRIAALDSGWDTRLENRLIQQGVGFVDPENELSMRESADFHDRNGHGTACIDIIQQHAPLAEIFPVRVFGRQLESSIRIIQAGIRWAVENQMHIINLSLGTQDTRILRQLYIACEYARRQGIIIVAATHNRLNASYPAVFDNVIGVAQHDYQKMYMFDYDPDAAIECRARGKHSTLGVGGQTMVNGTSFSAPVITALLALFCSANPTCNQQEIDTFLTRHSQPLVS